MKFTSLFVLIFLVSGLVSAATRVEQLNVLIASYNKRFVNGVYVKDQNQIRTFTNEQETLSASFKASGALKKLMVINNDYDTTLTVTLYAFVNEQNSLVSFYYEKTVYASDNERSFLRFRVLSDFDKGVGFVPVNGSFAVTVKGFYFKPDTSATIQFIYLTDLKKNSTAALNLFLLKKNNSWDFYTEKYQLVKEADVQTWSSFFPPNGGVQQISLK